MEREVIKLSRLLLLTISTPVKPGAIHRLRLGNEFENIIQEAVRIIEHMEYAYRYGRDLHRGSRTIASIGLGKLIGESMVSVFNDLEQRPIPGLHAAPITAALMLGYKPEGDAYTRLSTGVKAIIYRIPPEDSIALIEAMEASSLGDLLTHLDNKGITRRSIMLQGMSLGDLFEALSTADTGFMLTYKGLKILKELKSTLKTGKAPGIILDSYLALVKAYGLKDAEAGNLKKLAKMDAELVRRGVSLNNLLGGTFLLSLLTIFDSM